MGIENETLKWIRWYSPKPPASMLELGNQFLYIWAKPFEDFPHQFVAAAGAYTIAKTYFEHCGYEHVSLDLNGQNGALCVDLSKPFDLNRTFDIVTDTGTSEHVSDLWQCLSNIHAHTRPGSVILHMNPEPASWPQHGHWYRDAAFYRAYSDLTGYELIEVDRFASCGNTVNGWNTRAALRRSNKPFPSRADFDQIPIFKA